MAVRRSILFGGILTMFQHRSRNAPGGGPVDQLSVDSDLQRQKRFAAGGELVVGLANSIMWQFAGPDSHSNMSLLNFTFVQPILRNGSRRYVLELLTIVERADRQPAGL